MTTDRARNATDGGEVEPVATWYEELSARGVWQPRVSLTSVYETPRRRNITPLYTATPTASPAPVIEEGFTLTRQEALAELDKDYRGDFEPEQGEVVREPDAELVRPIIGIENRTAQEVFDIMADRIRRRLSKHGARSDAGD